LNDGALAATGAPFYFTQKTARNERFLVISCGFLLWTYVTVPSFVTILCKKRVFCNIGKVF
ncbi:hypothetical protein, partial [Enterococcus sp. RIT-PI-f]|uniref:hypothetical protein n=1 Tax=Enterococcus sp. RIT-PI-f TaxID=1690244 RepID=UPI00356A3DF0